MGVNINGLLSGLLCFELVFGSLKEDKNVLIISFDRFCQDTRGLKPEHVSSPCVPSRSIGVARACPISLVHLPSGIYAWVASAIVGFRLDQDATGTPGCNGWTSITPRVSPRSVLACTAP